MKRTYPCACFKLFIVTFFLMFFYLDSFSFQTNESFSDIQSQFYQEKDINIRFRLVMDMASSTLNSTESNAIAKYGVYLADSLGDKKKLAEAHEMYGVTFNKKGDYTDAIENLGLALQYFEHIKSPSDVAKVKRTMGETLRATKNYLLALDYLNQSLDYFLKYPDDVMLARIYNRIAATLYEMWYVGNESVFSKFLSENSSLPFKTRIALEPDLVIKDDSLATTLEISNFHARNAKRYDLVISSNIILGSYYVSTNQFEEAIDLFENTVQLIEKHQLLEDLPLIYLNWSRVYSIGYLGEPEKAIELSKKALEISKEQNIPAYIFMANNTIHANYAFLGDFENAYTYLLQQVPVIQEYGEKDLLAQLKTLEYQYNLQQSTQELKNKQAQLQLIFGSVMIIILIGAAFIYYQFLANAKQKELLAIQKEQNKIISDQNEELALINAEKDRFFAILAHDLKGPVRSVANSLALILEDLKSKDYEGALAMASAISSSANRASDLLQNLIQWAKSQRGKIQIHPQELDLNSLIISSIEFFQENIENKELEVIYNEKPGLTIIADKDILDTVIRNVLSNAIKFSYKNGMISIETEINNQHLILSVEDHGIGMDQEMVNTIFKIDSYNSRPGTAGEVSSGLGLILCKDFLTYINGEISLESKEGQGTRASITIPLRS